MVVQFFYLKLSESSARSLHPENSAAAAGISRKRVANEKVVMYGAASAVWLGVGVAAMAVYM